jgi:hypothetical protein
MADASHPPRLTQRARRSRLRLLSLMTLVAAVALTLAVTPSLMKLITTPLSGWLWDERLYYQISLALTSWTPILALIAAIRGRSRFRRASRSYGTSAVLAAAAAMVVLLVKRLIATIPGTPRGLPILAQPMPGSSFSPALLRLVIDAPEGAMTAIIAAWLILVLTRAGRGPSDWFDGLCLFFGLLWVAWYLGGDFILLLHRTW